MGKMHLGAYSKVKRDLQPFLPHPELVQWPARQDVLMSGMAGSTRRIDVWNWPEPALPACLLFRRLRVESRCGAAVVG